VFNTTATFLIHRWMMLVLNETLHQSVSNSLIIIIIFIFFISVISVIGILGIVISITVFCENMLQFHR